MRSCSGPSPNYLGDVNLGHYEFILTYTAFFMLVGLLGTNSYVVKATARDHGRVGPLVLNGVTLKLAMSAALSTAAFGLGATAQLRTARSSCCSARPAW